MYEKFENLLNARNVSFYEISKQTGIAPATFYAWKNGEYTPKADKLLKIADYFGVSIDYFLRD